MSIVLVIGAIAFVGLTVILARRRHLFLTTLSAIAVLVVLIGAWQADDEVSSDPEDGPARDALTQSARQPTADVSAPTP